MLLYVDDMFHVDYFLTISLCDLSNLSIAKISSAKSIINYPIAKIDSTKPVDFRLANCEIYFAKNLPLR